MRTEEDAQNDPGKQNSAKQVGGQTIEGEVKEKTHNKA